MPASGRGPLPGPEPGLGPGPGPGSGPGPDMHGAGFSAPKSIILWF